jgi:hypothetical protein
MMTSTPDELICGFPYVSLTKVAGDPTFKDLKTIRQLLNMIAMSIYYQEGEG